MPPKSFDRLGVDFCLYFVNVPWLRTCLLLEQRNNGPKKCDYVKATLSVTILLMLNAANCFRHLYAS